MSSLNIDAIVAAAKRTRNARHAGRARRAQYPDPGPIEVCNVVKAGEPNTMRCCRPKGHGMEHCYVARAEPFPPHNKRK